MSLETWTAQEFRLANFKVDQSALYVDPQSEKGREIDVVAQARDELGFVHSYFVVECKSAPKPWVVVKSLELALYHVNSSNLGLTSTGVSSEIKASLMLDKNLRNHLQRLNAGGYQFRQAFSGENDPGYAASMSALKAADAIMNSTAAAAPRLTFAMPVIVVDSPLIECIPTVDGKFALKEVEQSTFFFNALIPDKKRSVICVVTRAGLKEFCAYCQELSLILQLSLEKRKVEWVNSLKVKVKVPDAWS